MSHLEQIASRLPALYRDGELLAAIVGVPALSLEVFDEQALEVQRSHWFDSAYRFDDVARLAVLLDLAPETWQGLREFRAWVHSLRNAWLKNGTATRRPLEMFVDEYTRRFQAAVGIDAVTALGNWSETPSETRPALVEFPQRRRFVQIPDAGPVEPLHQQRVVSNDLDLTAADFFFVGRTAAREYMPVLVNTTRGEALIYTGTLGNGERLWLEALDDGTVRAYTDKLDVTDRLYSVSAVTPGSGWSVDETQRPAKVLQLSRGANDIWFLPVAHFDQPGLDRALLALAELDLKQGRWDTTVWDRSLFYQQPAADLWIAWDEGLPGTFEITVPGGILVNSAGNTEQALEDRGRLQFSLDLGIQRIKAAGVAATTRLLSFTEVQPSRDALCEMFPKTFREAGATGIDQRPDAGGVFTVSS